MKDILCRVRFVQYLATVMNVDVIHIRCDFSHSRAVIYHRHCLSSKHIKIKIMYIILTHHILHIYMHISVYYIIFLLQFDSSIVKKLSQSAMLARPRHNYKKKYIRHIVSYVFLLRILLLYITTSID